MKRLFRQTVFSIIMGGLLLIRPPFSPADASEGSSLQAKMQIYAEEGIKDNEHFIDQVDGLVTNHGDKKSIEMLARTVQRFVYTKTLYHSFKFGDAFDHVKRTQRLLVVLYERNVKAHHKYTKELWLKLTTEILNAKRYNLQKRIAIGFRALENAKIQMDLAKNIEITLHSNKIRHYIEALKYINNGLRNYIYTLITVKSIYPVEESSDFIKLEQNIFTGFPNNYKEVHLLLYTAFHKPYNLPSVKQKTWDEDFDYQVLLDNHPEYSDIEVPPVREVYDY